MQILCRKQIVVGAFVGDNRQQDIEYKQTDEWGGYERNAFSYDGLNVDETPSPEKLATQSKTVVSCISPSEFTEHEWHSCATPTEMYLYSEGSMLRTVNPTYGYAENEVSVSIRYNEDGSQNLKNVSATSYSAFRSWSPVRGLTSYISGDYVGELLF